MSSISYLPDAFAAAGDQRRGAGEAPPLLPAPAAGGHHFLVLCVWFSSIYVYVYMCMKMRWNERLLDIHVPPIYSVLIRWNLHAARVGAQEWARERRGDRWLPTLTTI